MAVHRNGLNNIRTTCGNINRSFTPYRIHLQLACLEMEKTRRKTDSDIAWRCISSTEERLKEIAAEQASLLEKLGTQKDSIGPTETKGNSRSALKIRY